MTSSAVSADQAAGQLLAQSVLDKAIRTGPPGWGGLTGTRELASADESSKTTYTYTIVADEIEESRHSLGRLFRVTVTVDWSDSLPGTRQNRGRMLVERSRLTYVELAEP
jgi:hypothetical protein